MIQPERITLLNRSEIRPGAYVLYWMQAAQRAECNHALEYAIDKANELKLPVVVAFGLTADFPEANLRHYHFMLQGLKETSEALAKCGIRMVIRAESPTVCIPKLARKASLLVVDEGFLTVQRHWRADVAENVACRMEEVETNLIVPVEAAAEKENFSAGTFRPRITRQLPKYLVPLKHRKPRMSSLDLKLSSLDLTDIDKVAKALKVDTSVGPAPGFQGGTSQAKRRLTRFIRTKLDAYDTQRNDPNLDAVSNLSPYLHFGQIAPLHIALKVGAATGQGKEAFLEELIVRRELSFNFVYYNHQYDQYDALPPWALRTLNYHARDKREDLYSQQEFETAKTHDPYWNAAQRQMVLAGKMHGYMRMYWGKKILEWSKSPQEGFRIALYLNNKYELDGRDPNGFAGVAWCFGKHDRAWGERPVFGKIRYMNAKGLKRKFDADAYVRKIERLEANP
jgi:deoxyribodipyrimidine photo-lyase